MRVTRFLGEEDGQGSLEESQIVILPVPFDLTSTWIKGADKGPQAILDASPHLEFFDIETRSEVYKQGIFTDSPVTGATSEVMVSSVRSTVAGHLSNGKFVVTLGGEHSISVGPIQAHAEAFENLSVLQLDAHTDLRETYMGSPYNHACVMARVKGICPIVQVGIRSMDIDETSSIVPGRIFYAHDIARSTGWDQDVSKKLTENVYVTIDLDVFDPGIMPSTGTPEPGGLNWHQVIDLLRTVSENHQIVGFDIVELCPGQNKAPDFLAAKLVYQLLSFIWRNKWEKS